MTIFRALEFFRSLPMAFACVSVKGLADIVLAFCGLTETCKLLYIHSFVVRRCGLFVLDSLGRSKRFSVFHLHRTFNSLEFRFVSFIRSFVTNLFRLLLEDLRILCDSFTFQNFNTFFFIE